MAWLLERIEYLAFRLRTVGVHPTYRRYGWWVVRLNAALPLRLRLASGVRAARRGAGVVVLR